MTAGGGGTKLAIVSLIATTALGFGGYLQKNQELEKKDLERSQKAQDLHIAQEQLQVQKDAAKVAEEDARSARGQWEAAQGQLAAKHQEIERLRQGSIDDTTVQIDSTRQLLKEAESVEARTFILQSFDPQFVG